MVGNLTGSMAALVTPMRGGRVDFEGLKSLYRIHAAAGTAGVVICGTTGESATLTHGEHQDVIDHAADFFPSEFGDDRPLLIAGTGSNSTAEAVSLTEFASERGVDAVLVITPYYNKPTPKGQILHYSEVANAAGTTPVILYNVPGRTGLKMTVDTIVELASTIPNIAAVKEASGDLELASEIVRRSPDDFVLLSGEDNLTLPMMALGARGVVSVTANLAPERVREMIDLCLEGSFFGARRIHQELFGLTEALFFETSPIPVKTAINMMAGSPAPGGGVWPEAGEFRAPLCDLSEAGRERLERELMRMGLLTKTGVAGV